MCWKPDGHCSNLKSVTDVIEEMTKVQIRSGNKPIVVHCSDTVTRSGMFCAIATTIERCKTEGVVDKKTKILCGQLSDRCTTCRRFCLSGSQGSTSTKTRGCTLSGECIQVALMLIITVIVKLYTCRINTG